MDNAKGKVRGTFNKNIRGTKINTTKNDKNIIEEDCNKKKYQIYDV